MNSTPSGQLLALCGPFGSGKDAVADILVRSAGFEKVSFAGPLRTEIAAAIRSQHIPEDAPLEVKTLLAVAIEHDLDPWAQPKPEPMRKLLQLWGTEYRRAQDPDYWVRLMAWRLGTMLHDTRVVIADMRFPNEYELVRWLEGKVWRVERSTLQANDARAHVSESFLDGFAIDRLINNNGTLEDLKCEVLDALAQQF